MNCATAEKPAGAIWGTFIGDALAMPVHWYYDRAALRRDYGSDWLSRRTAEQWSRAPDDVVIGQRVSPACSIADAFPASLYLAWKYADDFEAGLVANTNLGGDNCHRGAVLGALLGAAAGTGQIPARFCDGLHDTAALHRQVHRLAA